MNDDTDAPDGDGDLEDDSTRIASAATEATVLGPPVGADAESAAPEPAAEGSAHSRPGAQHGSSDWAHPERWERSTDGPVGVGTVLLNKYELVSEVDSGGMGVVYRALNRAYEFAQDSNPYVAIKVLHDSFSKHPKAVIALHREARKSQTLAHPNIINVRDFDRDGTTVFMSMELLSGQNLLSLILDNQDFGVEPETAVSVIKGVASALSYAHSKGIVHCDLKPGNIFLTDEGETKVLDFGIARAGHPEMMAGRGGEEDTKFNADDLGAMTPAYASPEMLDGTAPVPSDDVFALGIVAYQLLTGRHPFRRIRANQLTARDARPVPPGNIPQRQRKAIMRALQLKRADRQIDAAAFLREFEGRSGFRRYAVAATLAAVVLAAAAGYQAWRGTLDLPEVEFSSLPLAVQEQVVQSNVEGGRALRLGALNDAFFYFTRAYDLHLNNPDALDGLRRTADRFVQASADADPRDQRGVMRLLLCQDYLARYEPAVRACADTLGAGQCSAEALECPDPAAD